MKRFESSAARMFCHAHTITAATVACAQCRLNVDERLCNAAPDKTLFAYSHLCDYAVMAGVSVLRAPPGAFAERLSQPVKPG